MRRFLERAASAFDPLAAKQLEAVELQERYGAWSKTFFHELHPDEIEASRSSPELARAERLFREILSIGTSSLSPGKIAVTRFQLGLLFEREGRLQEAEDEYNFCLTINAGNLDSVIRRSTHCLKDFRLIF